MMRIPSFLGTVAAWTMTWTMTMTMTTWPTVTTVDAYPAAGTAAAAGDNRDRDHRLFLDRFGAHIQCPYANDWLRKGPRRAARELGLQQPPQRTLQQQSAANTTSTTTTDASSPSIPAATCALAPGPIGAAHQAADSRYLFDCGENAPGRRSPYMWPLRWSADAVSHSVPYGSDEVVYESKSRVYYRLDRNWKRADNDYQYGVQRSIGQTNCPSRPNTNITSNATDDAVLSLFTCERDSRELTTMIHRGSRMVFITWKNGTQRGSTDVDAITDCSWLDLQVVGNVRPDWFLDKRGGATDVQYLGNQHIYYSDGVPKLVKQWRKKDFASQYFTMSMQANPSDNGTEPIHWPLILNVPGEGFGDDFLRKYSDHRLLRGDGSDDALFLIDRALEASGRSCPQRASPSGEEGQPIGPPTLEEPIPSNLEIDPNAWVSIEYTYSPVWEPTEPAQPTEPSAESSNGGGASSSSSYAYAQVADGITIGSCYDSNTNAIQIRVEFTGLVERPLPWMAIGYRHDGQCAMVPADGSTTDVIFILGDTDTGEPTAYKGSLQSSNKDFDTNAVNTIYPTLSPLAETDGFSDVRVVVNDGGGDVASTLSVQDGQQSTSSTEEGTTVILQFTQTVDEAPGVLHLMYAMGNSPALGYHASRQCFDVTDFPECGSSTTAATATTNDNERGGGDPTTVGSVDDSTSGSGNSNHYRGALYSLPLAAMIMSAALVWA